MSLWLAIETATDIGSVALGEPGTVMAELVVAKRRHAAALLPSITELLKLGACSLTDVTGLVIADGPGGFTGLRIGFATLKGLARSREELKLRAAPSLMAAAWRARGYGDGAVAAWYDALRGEVFGAVYRFTKETVREVQAPARGSPRDLVERCGAPVAVVVGDGARGHVQLVREWTGRDPLLPPDGGPRASALIEMLAVPGALRSVEDCDALEPAYGRHAEAQVRWEAEHGKSLEDELEKPQLGSGSRGSRPR